MSFEYGVVFASDGVHYPATEDGSPDLEHPLFWDSEAEEYRAKTDKDSSHFDTYHVGHVELEFPGAEPIQVTESEANAVRVLLEKLREGN